MQNISRQKPQYHVYALVGFPEHLERFNWKISFTAWFDKKKKKCSCLGLSGGWLAFEMQLRSQHHRLTGDVWGSTVGERQSAQTLSASFHCLIAELIQPVPPTAQPRLSQQTFLSRPPLCFLPQSITTIPNQGAQPCIITLSTLLLFPSPGVGKSVERLLKGRPSRAQTEV